MTSYSSLADLKNILSIPLSDTSQDVTLQASLDVASRFVEGYCHRQFYADAVASTRVYRPIDPWTVLTEDFIYQPNAATPTLIVVHQDDGTGTYPNLLDVGTYYVEPQPRYDWQPASRLEAVQPAFFWQLYNRRTISVTARWGFPLVPDQVNEATLLTARDTFKQRNSAFAFGVVGIDEFGPIRARMNSQVRDLLAPFRRRTR
jgi:hypothetical protein